MAVLIAKCCDELCHCTLAELRDRNVYRGERRIEITSDCNVIEAGDSNVVRHGDASFA